MLSRLGAILMFVVACAAAPSKLATPWRVELLTSGGISGRGVGNVTLDSDGNVVVTLITRKECAFRATDAELREIEAILTNSHPKAWGSYVPDDKCCDRVEYRIAFGKYSAEWIDMPKPLPADLVALNKALTALRTKYARECSN